MKNFWFFIICLLTITLKAQNLHVNFFGGFGNYQGDLQDKQFTIKQSHPAFGLGVNYEITDKIFARANATFGKISGDDKKNVKNFSRNLNFSSNLIDVHIGAEYHLFSLYEKRITPYAFAGISYFNFNPYTFDAANKKVYLQPLSTEGQGFYQDRKEYSLNQISVPFGAGAKFAITDNIRVGFEIGMRKTFTDYLDDLSTTYVDQNILLANRGQQAVDLAFRGDELNPALPYPADGELRGKVKNKDWYYFSGFTVSFRLNSSNGGGSKKGLGCPRVN